MKLVKTNQSPTKVTLAIDADAAELEQIKKHVLNHFADRVQVPGFRGGRAPAHLIEKNANQQELANDFLEHAINELFQRAVRQENLRPVGQPNVSLKKFVPYTVVSFEAELEVVGAVKLAAYKTIKLAKPKITVTAEDVNGVLKSLQKRMAERLDVERAAKNDDELTIDFAGKDEKGAPVAGADGKDYALVLGSKTFIPGFEENLIGLKAGDKKEFDVTFPKDYGVAALQSKKVSFSVTVKKVSELVEPKLDDEFAAKSGTFKTLAELKVDVKKQITSEKEFQAEQAYQNELIQKISEKSSVEVPKILVDEQIERAEEEEKRNLMYRGQTWQEHLDSEGVTEVQHRDRQRPDAEARVKAGLILSEISEKESIDVTPEELDTRIAVLKTQYQDPAMQAELDKPEGRRDIASRILTEKTITKLVDYASK